MRNSGSFKLSSPKQVLTATSLLEKILADLPAKQTLSSEKRDAIQGWLEQNAALQAKAPFKELSEDLRDVLQSGVLSQEKSEDLQWLLNSLKEGLVEPEDLKFLRDLLAGMGPEGVLNSFQMGKLRAWLNARTYLQEVWPYEELLTALASFKYVEKIPYFEINAIKNYVNEFLLLQRGPEPGRGKSKGASSSPVLSICSLRADLGPSLSGKSFYIAGSSPAGRGQSLSLGEFIQDHGGRLTPQMNPVPDYLVISAEAPPAWKYSRYGSKVATALALKKAGHRIHILLESQLRTYLKKVV